MFFVCFTSIYFSYLYFDDYSMWGWHFPLRLRLINNISDERAANCHGPTHVAFLLQLSGLISLRTCHISTLLLPFEISFNPLTFQIESLFSPFLPQVMEINYCDLDVQEPAGFIPIFQGALAVSQEIDLLLYWRKISVTCQKSNKWESVIFWVDERWGSRLGLKGAVWSWACSIQSTTDNRGGRLCRFCYVFFWLTVTLTKWMT